MRILDLGTRIPTYWMARRQDRPDVMPMNYTLSLTYQCNSRCATCNIWRREPVDELAVEEWERILASIGDSPYWVTLSGGEPLLRSESVAIAKRVCGLTRPAVLNIPTNGLLPTRIVEGVQEIAVSSPGVDVVVNLSLDGWGEDHDRIRGVPGNFKRAMQTYRGLRALNKPNLTLGIHTVISRLNVEKVPDLYVRVLENLAPDSYITEIAEERVELGTLGAEITPAAEAYRQTIEMLMTLQESQAIPVGLGKITWAFRQRYYRLVQHWLQEGTQPVPCYAGWASGQIMPDGEVWFCCIKGQSIGNLRDVDYDFRALWRGDRAVALRERMRTEGCSCPLANAAYTNLLLHPQSLVGIARDIVTNHGSPARKRPAPSEV